jgi:thiamine transport system ATP-binding protein
MLVLDNLLVEAGSFQLRADITLNTGSRTAIIGASGSGKSTLLNAVAGFLKPTSGRIRWGDRDLNTMPAGERPLSILFQDQNLFPHLTVAQNIGLGISPKLRLTPDDIARVQESLARTGLAGLGERTPNALSGGQQSRVALARALLRARPMLLLDEPFAALGPALKDEMLALVDEIAAAEGLTILMVSHDPDDARRLCPQTIFVSDGSAHPAAPTHELLAHPPSALRAYLGDREIT